MRRYELMLLLRPDLEDDKLQSAVEKVTRAVVNAGGSLTKVSPWGKRRLAYDIQRFREASYFLIHFDIEPSQVRGIERGMLISEEILRHLVTLIEDRGPARQEIPAAAPARAAQLAEEPVGGQPVGQGPEAVAAAPADEPAAAPADEPAVEEERAIEGKPAPEDETEPAVTASESDRDEEAGTEPAEEPVEA